VKPLYTVVALIFLTAQVPLMQAVACPAVTGADLRSCCCDQAPATEPMSGCCSTDAEPTENATHASCSCAWAPASPDTDSVISIAPNLPRTKLPTLHQPNDAPALLTLDAEKDVARYVQPPVRTLRDGTCATTHAPKFILLCSILR